MWMKRKLVLVIGVMIAATLACGPIDLARDILGRLPTVTPTASSERHESTIWYVAIDGDDGNLCQEPSDPCRTIQEVLSRVTDDDVVHIGPGTYAEPISTGRMLTIRDLDLVLEGAGAGDTVLDAGGTGTVIFAAGDSRITLRDMTLRNGGGNNPGNCLSVRYEASGTVERVNFLNCSKAGVEHTSQQPLLLRNVLIENAQPDPALGVGYGGEGLKSHGNLSVQDSRIANNAGHGVLVIDGEFEMMRTVIEGNGLEGVFLRGRATLTSITVRNNAADPEIGAFHAGLVVEGTGQVNVVSSEISSNDVGVSMRDTAELTLRRTTVEAHPRTGIVIADGASVTIEDSVIRDNGSRYAGTSLPGGIDNDGRLTVRESVIAENHNGGIGNDGPGAELFLLQSTVEGNRGNLAGVYNLGTAVIEGSLVTGDSNTQGAVVNRGSMTMLNSTISGNAGIGLDAVSGRVSVAYSTITANGDTGFNSHLAAERVSLIAGSLIAGNGSRGDCLFGVLSPPAALRGGNIDSDGSCGFARMESLADLHIMPLADNGGPTWTHALGPDSAAIEAATDDCPPEDQRGTPRPQGVMCDVGAYEAPVVALSATGAPAFATVTPTPSGAQPVVMIDTLCWEGPGPMYQVVSSLSEGTQVTLLGRGAEGDWWVIDNPRYPGVACWVEDDDLSVDPLIELDELRIYTIPPLPTPTATPILGCLYYDQNQAEVCYPIDQCPVDFEDSLGACTP